MVYLDHNCHFSTLFVTYIYSYRKVEETQLCAREKYIY